MSSTTDIAGTGQDRFRVIAIDDEPAFLRAMTRLLSRRGFEILSFGQAAPALAVLEAERDRIDLLLIDRHMSDGVDGVDVLIQARRLAPEVPAVIVTGDTRDSTAAAALRAGAFHFIAKPVLDVDAMALTLVRACNFSRLSRQTRALQHRAAVTAEFENMIGASVSMSGLFALIAKLADADINVLIAGESGTGKELTARALHERSARAHGPFVALNCGAMPETLIDSELFGHVRGAFTGAVEARDGVFVEAHGGVLFLDEIGELPLAVQTRLLRVLQEREVRPLGASAARKVDVRVIAASHVDLEAAVDERRFRADLYYRLNVVTITVPPLRDRVADIPLLAAHLIGKHAALRGKPAPALTQAAVAALTRHDWPGNVRELENAMQHALAMKHTGDIDVDALPPAVCARAQRAEAPPAATVHHSDLSWADDLGYQEARRAALERFERAYLLRLLARTGGNLSEAARRASLDRSNLRRILGRLRLRNRLAGDAAEPGGDEPA